MRIAIIGCGNMGRGLAQRLSQMHHLFLYDRNPKKAGHLAQEGYGQACTEMKEALHHGEVIILAVKPQNIEEVARLMGNDLQNNQIIISLLAGTPLAVLRRFFPAIHIVRMMPNLPLMCGAGVIGLSSDEKTNQEHLTKAFEPLGKIYWLPEEKIDALTALASSGPAFFFAMIEAMIDAGIVMGFPAKEAQDLVYQMLQGSLTLLASTHHSPGELKRQIASPGGTTIAGLKKLEESALHDSIIAIFLSTYERAHKLSSQWEKGV